MINLFEIFDEIFANLCHTNPISKHATLPLTQFCYQRKRPTGNCGSKHVIREYEYPRRSESDANGQCLPIHGQRAHVQKIAVAAYTNGTSKTLHGAFKNVQKISKCSVLDK